MEDLVNTKITLITVPYDAGHLNERMGAGPLHLANNGLIEKLNASGYTVEHKQLNLHKPFPTEVTSTFKLLNQISDEVNESITAHSFPIVLSGNCIATVGALAGVNEPHCGVIWFDAHGDCETPETTQSGFLDGMALSILTGSCWQNMLASVDDYSPIHGNRIMLVGARDLSNDERRFIQANKINQVPVKQIFDVEREALKLACTQLSANGVQKLHVHIDADVLDPSVAPANSFAVNNGLSKQGLIKILKYTLKRLPVLSLTVASYDPSYDVDNRML